MNDLTHAYAEVNGIRLHYAAAGSGRLMVFLHGFPEFWYCWRRQLSEFGRDHLAVAPDLRGYNLSDKPAEIHDYRIKPIVEDLRQLIAKLGGGRATVVAHDWGGGAAWALAIQHPECVEKLVIINSPHPIPFARTLKSDPAQQAASAYMLLLRDAKAERVLSEDNFRRLIAILNGWAGGDASLSELDIAAYREAWSQPGALSASLNWYRAAPIYPPSASDPGAAALSLDPEKFKVRVPTLVIWGDRDQALLPVLLEGLDELISDLRIVRIPDGSHWVIREKPEQVNQLIRQFIES